MVTDKDLYTIEEVSTKLRVAYLTVYRWVKSGKLGSLRAGRQYRIPQKSLDIFLHHNNKHKN
jgi:excisionase family DNA binding protein